MGVDKSAEKVANAIGSLPDRDQRAKVVELVYGRGSVYFINKPEPVKPSPVPDYQEEEEEE